MVESLQMFLFLFKSKYRRKCSWFSPFLCSVLIVLLFCNYVVSKCDNCVNGVCENDTCVCFGGWQGPGCQHCGGKIRLTSLTGIITDGPGNYSVSVQCTWLIAPKQTAPPPPIRIRLESFATECGWDHLYIYDGNSVKAEKLLGVFSGVYQGNESTWSRQIIARSGRALIHFFSDDAFSMEGFNITYSVYSCPSNSHYTNCSKHGVCEDGTCICSPGWTGLACDKPMCPENCNSLYGFGSCVPRGCVCADSRRGSSCERPSSLSGFSALWPQEPQEWATSPPNAAGHKLLQLNGNLLSVGGEFFANRHFLYKYIIEDNVWSPIDTRGLAPSPRFLHSAVMHNNELIVYGGIMVADNPEIAPNLSGLEGKAGQVTNEVWRISLDSNRPQWVNATPTSCAVGKPAPLGYCGGLHNSGHTAVLVRTGATRKPVMLVFFGHSPQYGYLHLVQEFDLESGHWSLVNTRGWPARNGFAHSSAYDELSHKVYLHGGLVSQSEATQAPSAGLHEYDVETKIFRPLPSSTVPRYLHSATFVSPGIMLVFGGNAHNDTAAAILSHQSGSKCYTNNAMLYHVRCSTWLPIPSPISARAAHAAIKMPGTAVNTVILYGGFDGRLRSDAYIFEAGDNCSSHASEYSCMQAASLAAVSCVWLKAEKQCVHLEEIGWKASLSDDVKACLSEPILDERHCGLADSCGSCTALGCVWCGSCYLSPAYCTRHRHQMALSIDECIESSAREVCNTIHSCTACQEHRAQLAWTTEELGPRACFWDYDSFKCRRSNVSEDVRRSSSVPPCPTSCAMFHSCANCTAEECIWCTSTERCVDKNAYVSSFPLGGCRAWQTGGCVGGGGGGGGCGVKGSCSSCLEEPACGWCDHEGGTGKGICLAGNERAPQLPEHCPDDRWHFTHCPLCQCNGHSTCTSQGKCRFPCGGRAVGEHCEQCARGHWGSSVNGGVCQPCECNFQAVSCAPDTGKCYCSTKGLTGDRCDKCDSASNYHADLYNKGECYYDLLVDYQFTFNLSKREDRHLSAINFRNVPSKTDVDADFSISCLSHALMNITIRTKADPEERVVFSDVNCSNFRYKFVKSDYTFGKDDNSNLTTFYVYVYDFQTPIWIQISFSQYPKLNLQQFFITFSSCFMLLLLVAAALWKIKQKYDVYRRRQRLFVEMEQMASRPFGCVSLALEGTGAPAPLALEPCAGGRAAVLSLALRLPPHGRGLAPPTGGLALASALVTLGPHHDKRH